VNTLGISDDLKHKLQDVMVDRHKLTLGKTLGEGESSRPPQLPHDQVCGTQIIQGVSHGGGDILLDFRSSVYLELRHCLALLALLQLSPSDSGAHGLSL